MGFSGLIQPDPDATGPTVAESDRLASSVGVIASRSADIPVVPEGSDTVACNRSRVQAAIACRLANSPLITADMSTHTKMPHHRRLESVEGYLLLGMPSHALRELDALRKGGFDSPVVTRTRAEALRDLRRYAEALAEYERLDCSELGDLTTLMGMGWCLKRLDRLDEAIEALQRAYRAHPDEPVVLYNLACYLCLAGDKTQCLSWLGRALRMEPNLRHLIVRESDFDNLREDPDFQFMVADPRTADEAS